MSLVPGVHVAACVPASLKIGDGPSPAPAPAGTTSWTVPNTNSQSTIMVVPMIHVAALTASTPMSNCSPLAESDIRPGGMCGYQANQMARQAATDKTTQIEN